MLLRIKKEKNFSIQNLFQKLKNDTVTLKEFEIILDTLGYKLRYTPKKIIFVKL